MMKIILWNEIVLIIITIMFIISSSIISISIIIIIIIRLYQNCLPCVITGQRTQSSYRMLTGNTGTGSVR